MAQKTILFDLDGTLTDSAEGIINCVIPALEHFGLNVPSRKELQVFIGPPLTDTFPKFGVPADRTDEAIHIFHERYIPIGKYENRPYPGIVGLLETLQAHGHKLYVATSKPEAMALEVLDHFDLTRHFDMVCGAYSDTVRSTKDAVIAYLLEECGQTENVVMVGDTVFDVEGAAAHGIPTIGVAWGYGNVEDMKNAGAIAIAHTMEELLELLEK